MSNMNTTSCTDDSITIPESMKHSFSSNLFNTYAVIIAGKRRVIFKPKDKKKRKSHKYYQSWKERVLKEYMKDYLINSRNFSDNSDFGKFKQKKGKGTGWALLTLIIFFNNN